MALKLSIISINNQDDKCGHLKILYQVSLFTQSLLVLCSLYKYSGQLALTNYMCIYFRDLAARNVLVHEDGTAKVYWLKNINLISLNLRVTSNSLMYSTEGNWANMQGWILFHTCLTCHHMCPTVDSQKIHDCIALYFYYMWLSFQWKIPCIRANLCKSKNGQKINMRCL